MLRLFKESLTRRITALDGEWYYCKDETRTGARAGWMKALPPEKLPIIVPSCWNNEPGMIRYEGDVWLETDFDTQLPNARLVFGAVNNECDVYLDGRLIGSHYGGFTEFSLVCENLRPGMHHLSLRTSNDHNSVDTLPLTGVDWFHYGGVIRSVEVHEFDKAAIERIKIEYTLDAANTAQLSVKVQLRAFGTVNAPVALSLDGKTLAQADVSVCGTGEVTLHAALTDVERWSPRSPRLYTFTVSFAEDTLRERTGFRTIEIRDRQFLLNGEPFTFKGVNRHEEHPDWGFAVPIKLVKRDIDIIRGMGCNMIRGSHYPNAKTTLDYMDETGMMFWEEIPMWGFPEEALRNETARARGVQLHTEMVTRDYNHPCIIVWGLNNEVATNTQAGQEVAALFRSTLRAHDTTRLITYASNHPLDDVCFAFADFISINYYIGWYGGPLEKWPGFLDQLTEYLEKTGNGHKPLVMSEFGAGGVYGETAFEDVMWTENYQAEYLAYTLDLFMHHPRMNGTIVWQYCDIRVDLEPRRALSRPRSFNNKGVVNEYRHPKMAYYTVKKAYTAQEGAKGGSTDGGKRI